jgi:hypothetical protein
VVLRVLMPLRKMKAVCSTETSVSTCRTTGCHDPERRSEYLHHSENLCNIKQTTRLCISYRHYTCVCVCVYLHYIYTYIYIFFLALYIFDVGLGASPSQQPPTWRTR